MHPRDETADGDDSPTFFIWTKESDRPIGVNAAASNLLGIPIDASLSSQGVELIASLTGRSFVDEISDLDITALTTKSLPGLLLGVEHRVIPAMLECRLVDNGVLVRATEIGNRDLLGRGTIDTDATLRAAIEVAPGSILTIDELGSILSFNGAAERAFGYTAPEIIGRNVSVLMNSTDATRHEEHLRRYLHTGERHIIGAMRVVEARRKNGEIFPVELYIDEVRFGDRRIYVGFLRDIEHRVRLQSETATLQRELIHVTRLASMGEMAAALAHELNQPLTAISAFAEAARLKLEGLGTVLPVSARECLAKVTAQALRAGEIIRRMRQLATGGAGQRDPEDLNLIVREAMALAAIGTKTLGIETSVVENASLPLVICDRIQVQQVIINLVRNAIDAFDDARGNNCDTSGSRRIVIETTFEGRRAMVSVSDTGPGVADDVRDHLFDSFLTTKALGVGLGLSVSRMIIESHGGKLWFDPQSNNGAIFRFTLPLQGGRSEI